MCGIVGILNGRGVGREQLQAELSSMNQTMHRRGPDHSDQWVHDEAFVGFGHRRLSIVDLSPSGNQPMKSHCGHYMIVFNGEVYNHEQIRKRLPRDHHWRGSSDTETVLAAISEWGIESAVKSFNGMFAFALWDFRINTLSLVRDRIGEKPMYYGRVAKDFVFASELKPFMAHPQWQGRIRKTALSSYLQFSYVAQPESIFEGIEKLAPAHILTIRFDRLQSSIISNQAYWSIDEVASRPRISVSQNDATEMVHKALLRAVELRMMSDVPLGAFLSGGIDSSLIVALMQKLSNGATKTFSIGFGEERFNEAPYAAKVAKALGTQHSELYVTAEDCMTAVPLLPEMYDEPFADSSQIPTYLVSKMARRHVTVALSGDAGDEVFGGYHRYTWLPKVWRYAEAMPDLIRKVLGRSSLTVPPNLRRLMIKLIAKQLKLSPQSLDLQMIKALRVLTSSDVNDAYLQVISSGLPNSILNEDWTSTDRATPKLTNIGLSLVDTLMLNDQKLYLSDDILVKLDRASMYASLEARAVFLDHELMELLWTIPTEQKIIGARRKIILHDILGSYLPRNLIDRPKMGFALPIGDWLRGGLKEWCMDLLATKHLESDGIFNSSQVEYLLTRHMSGHGDHQLELWPILMFQAWKTHHRVSA